MAWQMLVFFCARISSSTWWPAQNHVILTLSYDARSSRSLLPSSRNARVSAAIIITAAAATSGFPSLSECYAAAAAAAA